MTTNISDRKDAGTGSALSEEELLSAYKTLKEQNIELEHNKKHGRRWLWISITFLILFLTAIDLIHWWWLDRNVAEQHKQEMSTTTTNQDENSVVTNLLTVKTQPISKHLGLIGQVAAGQIVNVTSPFQSKILSMGFSFGERVTKGQKLLQLDTSFLDSTKRTAQIAQIQAQEELDTLLAWSSNNEVTAARRTLEEGKHNVANAKKKKTTDQELFKEGIISKDELDNSIDQLSNYQDALISAQEQLEQTLAKGNKKHIELARLKLQNSSSSLEEIKKNVDGADILSPMDGVTLQPKISQADGKTGSVSVGTPVSAQQVLLAIGDMESLQIKVSVSELDINNIKPGLNVIITGESLGDKTFSGKVTTVGNQAESAGNNSLASYPVIIALQNPSDNVGHYIRLGIHVKLEIVIYKNPKAVVIPKSAVHGDVGKYFVKRMDKQKNQLVSTPVKLGHSLANGIEITQGLSAGDRIQQ